LLREFMSDRNLSRYAAVILDEAHERSMQTDILFGLMRTYIAKHGEKAPRLIIMSATLNSAQV
jgi:HrpA-like RNA helicase